VRLDLLEAQLAVAEDLVDHLLREDAHALDVGERLRLQLRDTRIVGDETRLRGCGRTGLGRLLSRGARGRDGNEQRERDDGQTTHEASWNEAAL
jgi:hypothetical protein